MEDIKTTEKLKKINKIIEKNCRRTAENIADAIWEYKNVSKHSFKFEGVGLHNKMDYAIIHSRISQILEGIASDYDGALMESFKSEIGDFLLELENQARKDLAMAEGFVTDSFTLYDPKSCYFKYERDNEGDIICRIASDDLCGEFEGYPSAKMDYAFIEGLFIE